MDSGASAAGAPTYRTFVFDSPAVHCPGMPIYRGIGGKVGASMYWEQQHLLRHLGQRGHVEYRERQARSNLLNRLAAEWDLGENSWDADAVFCKTVTLCTTMVLPWLLSTCVRRGPHMADSKTQILGELLRSFGKVALEGLQHLPAVRPLAVRNATGHVVALIPAWPGAGAGSYGDVDKLENLYPEALHAWQEMDSVLPCGWRIAAIEQATMLDWMLFASFAHRLGSRGALRALLDSIKQEANKVLSLGIEVWLLAQYIPAEMSGRETVATILTKSGRQQIRRNDFSKAVALLRSSAAGGSSGAYMAGALGDAAVDNAMTRAMCSVFFDDLNTVFGGGQVRRLSWAWDPGSYGGVQYSVGVCHSLDNNRGAILPVMVRCQAKAGL